MPKDSYVASLFRLGGDRIIQKVGEEAIEVVIAAKNKIKKELFLKWPIYYFTYWFSWFYQILPYQISKKSWKVEMMVLR